MANKTLTARVKIDTRSAEASLTRLSQKIKAIDKLFNGHVGKGGFEKQTERAILQQERLRQATLKTKLAEEKLTTQKYRTAAAAQRVKQHTEQTARQTALVAQQTSLIARTSTPIRSQFSGITGETLSWEKAQLSVLQRLSATRTMLGGLLSTLKSIIGLYLGIGGIKLMLNTSDTITKAENQLNNIDGGSPERTAKTMDKIYAASERSRGKFSAMLSDVGKLMTLAPEAFQNNEDNAIRFQEIMNKAYKLGNMSASEQATSMYQLVQALGSGILQGDELRSVREGASLMYKEMEKNIQGILNTDKSLKDLASRGIITSDMVVWAVMKSGNKIDERFKKTQMTFEDVGTHIKNTAVQVMRKVQDRLVELFNSEKGKKFLENIDKAIVGLGNVLIKLIDKFASFFNWCSDNWNWLKNVIIGVFMAKITWAIIAKEISIACTLLELKVKMLSMTLEQQIMVQLAMRKIALATLTSAVIILSIMAIVYVFFLWKSAAINTCDAIASAIIILGIIATIVLSIMTGGIVLIPALVAIGIALIIKYLDYFLGVVYSIGAFIYNLVVGVIDACIQAVYTCIEPILFIVEWIVNCFNGGFDGIGGACANLIGQIIGWFLSLGKVVTKIIDAIFGTDWTSGLESLRQSVTSWGKTEKAITLTSDAPTLNSLTDGAIPDRITYGSAWNKGLEHGKAAMNWTNDFGAKFQNPNGMFNTMGDLPNINDASLGVNGSYDPTGANDDIAKALDKISGDTDDIKDKMEMENDELEYLRKIAEMEWQNKFTTAEIKIDMTNNNNINSELDLDGLVSHLGTVLQEEMYVLAEGAH